jgi:hypothetical protein
VVKVYFLKIFKYNSLNIIYFNTIIKSFKISNIFIYLFIFNFKDNFFFNFLYFYKNTWNKKINFNLNLNKNIFLSNLSGYLFDKFFFYTYHENKLILSNFFLFTNRLSVLKNNKNFIIKNKIFYIYKLFSLSFFFNFLDFYKKSLFFIFIFSLFFHSSIFSFFKIFNLFKQSKKKILPYRDSFVLNLRSKESISLLSLSAKLI